MNDIRASKGEFFRVLEVRPDYESRPLWLRYLIAIVLAVAMTGCAFHSEALHSHAASEIYHSRLGPQAVASCIVRASARPLQVSSSPDGEVRVDDNGPYGFKFEQWSIYPDGTGSRAEFRKLRMGGSHGGERACFGG